MSLIQNINEFLGGGTWLQMEITRIKDGLWDIGGRGKLERTPEGTLYVRVNNPGEQWGEAERAQIEQFKENLDCEVDRDWR